MSQKKYIKALKQKAIKRSRLQKLDGRSTNDIAAAIWTGGNDFLQTPEWKAVRDKTVSKYGGKCMCCGSTPKRGINVDHIKSRRDFPDLALDENNLQVLCGPCNKRKGNKHHTDYRKQ